MKPLKYIPFLLALAGCADNNIIESGTRIVNLTCDRLVRPVGIDNPVPAFSWQLEDSTHGQHQSAWRILVSLSEKSLETGEGDIWDSGKITGDECVSIVYNGKTLESRKRYYWKVRIWDRDGNPSSYSEPSYFETGLLNDSDWSGKWISAPTLFDWSINDRNRKLLPKNAPPEEEGPSPVFRKEFEIDRQVESARAYITGLGFFELYINGEKTGDGLMDPAFTDYSRTVLYLTFDITELLKQGSNVAGIMLGNGWYHMISRDVWSFDFAPWRDKPVLLCQLEIKYSDGTREVVASDLTWKCYPGPVVFNSIRQGETFDARMEPEGWSVSGFNDKGWFPVREARMPAGKLKAQCMPSVKITSELTPVSITKTGQGEYLVDFGQAMAGFARVRARGSAGTKIILKYGELLDKGGRLDQGNINTLVAIEPFQTDAFILKGSEQAEIFQPRFTYHGFRYVEVKGFPGELQPSDITACAIHTAFKTSGTFECSDSVLNRIHQNTLWSFISNYHGYPTDCPHREKNGWTGDAQLASETGLYNFDLNASYVKWIGDLVDAQLVNGMLPGIAPTAGWGYYWGNGPAWDHALFAIPWNTWIYTGDKSLIEKAYPAMKKYMGLIRSKADGHLVSWGLGDWCPARTTTPEVITSTGYYYEDARIISLCASLLGFKEEEKYYSLLSDSIRMAFREKLYDAETGIVGNGSQTAQSAALYFGFLEGDAREKAFEKLIENLEASDLNIDVGILGAKYLLNVLSSEGSPEIAYRHIVSSKFPGWANWITQGATTLWENWNGEASRIHIMYGDVDAWFYKNLAGIKSDQNSAGFRHFVIDPFIPEGMEWARGSHLSPYGTIRSAWEKTGEGLILNVSIPCNSSATMYFPGNDRTKIRLHGRPVIDGDNIRFIEDSGGEIMAYLASGDYAFTVLN
ncbi:MAG TPA: glycoside hydrolase family 78 protein [Cyclobacteriaceae bacterium]|nr:glycoside hydrolase family 78 protein [Cyclobacteriaceae bacterium]